MNNKALYLECYSGISGDMTVAALLDLGASREKLEKVLNSLSLKGFKIEIKDVIKSGIRAKDFNVLLDKEIDNHDHDMEYLHGEKKDNEHLEDNGNKAEYHHEHHHNHAHYHKHRGIDEINDIIDNCSMTDNAKKIAKKVFDIIARAEAKAHNTSVKDVRFHEVGAVDSIVDIVSVAVCLDDLGIKDVIVPFLCEGRGTVRCMHGILPVPVPAVLNIVSENNIALKIIDSQGEFVTPTGAAIVAAIKTKDSLPEKFKIKNVGMGAGKREYERPSLLRACIIESSLDDEQNKATDSIYKLETNIDDCSGESLGYVMEKLLEAGAKDVFYTPVFMKKNRPAWLLSVICKKSDINVLEEIIFTQTTTIGIRKTEMKRSILNRKIMTVKTKYGKADVKVCSHKNKVEYYPEYESVKKICDSFNVSYDDAYGIIRKGAYEQLE